ncbi:mas-related G-protein coupled receptor member H-like [Varanus komodoensis]|uniref:mas-related G-protein coupled receptor member H-like n=1 Tax=Varanus komodoensis TaxID=61221 RepID=UPI001CF7C2FF|nr:mas-related G-protein coupled receptor member H-like [Varanus komodoensis]
MTTPTSQSSLDGGSKLGMNETDVVYFRNESIIFSTLTLALCLFGFMGNGTIIWLLGFHIKRNPFSTCILHLAVADLGVLINLALIATSLIQLPEKEHITLAMTPTVYSILRIMYCTSQLLLIVISIDRCVVVLFPIWHRCHRPPKLPTIICILIWVLSFTLFAISVLVLHVRKDPLILGLLTVLLYPLMAASTLILFVKVHYKQHHCQKTTASIVILLALLFFLIFNIPVGVYVVISNLWSANGIVQSITICVLSGKSNFTISVGNASKIRPYLSMLSENLAFLCITLNSSINPILYFFAGREKKDWFALFRMKVALQKLFQEEEDQRQVE